MNFEGLPFIEQDGVKKDRSIVVYALSTCGFCKRAMAFLEEHGFAYTYIHVDQIPVATKNEIKQILKDRFKENVAFPFAVFDDREHLVGFIKPDWERTLGLGKGE
jgi:glutaredoxin